MLRENAIGKGKNFSLFAPLLLLSTIDDCYHYRSEKRAHNQKESVAMKKTLKARREALEARIEQCQEQLETAVYDSVIDRLQERMDRLEEKMNDLDWEEEE